MMRYMYGLGIGVLFIVFGVTVCMGMPEHIENPIRFMVITVSSLVLLWWYVAADLWPIGKSRVNSEEVE